MAYQDIAVVNVNLQTTSASQAGFGTQIFIGTHAWFRERVRAYTSLTAAATDIPSTAPEYVALEKAFAQNPQPSSVKIGRRESITTITPDSALDATPYTVRVEVSPTDFVVATYTASVPTDTEFEICTALKAAIDGVPALLAALTTTVVGVGSAAVLTIEATASTDKYAVSGLVNVTASFTTTETAGDVLAAIEVEDSDYYFVTSSDHTEAYVLAMAAAIEARKKLYFVSSESELSLAALASPATDTLGKITDLNYLRTITMYAQDADTTFPECAFVARWSPSLPGTVAWFTKVIAGLPAATALNGEVTAVPLSATQKGNLIARNANFIDTQRGVDILYGGKSSGGEWIDVLRSRDYIEDQTEVAIFNLMLNNGKIPMDDDGIAQIESVCTSTWDRFISSSGRPNILDSQLPYISTFPRAADVSFPDKVAREYSASATLYLAGAIMLTTITVNLTYPS